MILNNLILIEVLGSWVQVKNKNIYMKALGKWGLNSQLTMMIEECSELIKAICKNWREKNEENIIEEIADVEIMIEQLKIAYGEEKIDKVKNTKLERLKKCFK